MTVMELAALSEQHAFIEWVNLDAQRVAYPKQGRVLAGTPQQCPQVRLLPLGAVRLPLLGPPDTQPDSRAMKRWRLHQPPGASSSSYSSPFVYR